MTGDQWVRLAFAFIIIGAFGGALGLVIGSVINSIKNRRTR